MNAPAAPTAQVVAVNISGGGIPKLPLDRADVTHSGLAGDQHDHEKHNTPLQAVSIIDVEDIDDLREEGFAVEPGATGENMTVRGLDVDTLDVGDRLDLSGGVRLELTKKRNPCYVLDAIDPDLKKAIIGRCGFYAKVITEGSVRAGETIAVTKHDDAMADGSPNTGRAETGRPETSRGDTSAGPDRNTPMTPRMAIETLKRLVLVGGLLTGVNGALAQERFEPVEEGVADADPLAVGLRELQVDLRDPTGFEQVYRVPGRADLLMRVDGGLFAIFPRSVYSDTRAGRVPLIPNNTTFFIGEPRFDLLPPAEGGDLPTAAAPVPGRDRARTRLERRLAVRPLRPALGLRVEPRIGEDVDPEVGPDIDQAASASPAKAGSEVGTAPVVDDESETTTPDRAPSGSWHTRIHELMRRAAANAKRR